MHPNEPVHDPSSTAVDSQRAIYARSVAAHAHNVASIKRASSRAAATGKSVDVARPVTSFVAGEIHDDASSSGGWPSPPRVRPGTAVGLIAASSGKRGHAPATGDHFAGPKSWPPTLGPVPYVRTFVVFDKSLAHAPTPNHAQTSPMLSSMIPPSTMKPSFPTQRSIRRPAQSRKPGIKDWSLATPRPALARTAQSSCHSATLEEGT